MLSSVGGYDIRCEYKFYDRLTMNFSSLACENLINSGHIEKLEQYLSDSNLYNQ